MKTRPYNFGAGPAMLPEAILLEAQEELLDWQGTGMSVMEVGHRTDLFRELLEKTQEDLRDLLDIPDNYDILFLGGAARTQFAMVPLNLLEKNQRAGYLITGLWSSLAYDEARKLKQAYCVASTQNDGFTTIPTPDDWAFHEETAYLYYTPNETVNGIRFMNTPKAGDIPLIADMTSCLLSEPIRVTDYGLIFAGAQKNLANAGLTVVIVRRDLLDKKRDEPIPTMLDYRVHAHHNSLYATPPTFNCYLAQKMFAWIRTQGGVTALYQMNCKKAERLYHYIDSSPFYHCGVQKEARSLMNICFSLAKQELQPDFLRCAKLRGLCGLQGHRSVGGLRASLYNAMPMAGVEALISFMQEFSQDHFR